MHCQRTEQEGFGRHSLQQGQASVAVDAGISKPNGRPNSSERRGDDLNSIRFHNMNLPGKSTRVHTNRDGHPMIRSRVRAKAMRCRCSVVFVEAQQPNSGYQHRSAPKGRERESHNRKLARPRARPLRPRARVGSQDRPIAHRARRPSKRVGLSVKNM